MVQILKVKSSYLFISLFTFMVFTSFGQVKSNKVNVQWGFEEKVKKSTLSDIVGYDESGIYTTKVRMKNFKLFHSLVYYNNTLNESKTLELDLKYKKKKLN